MDIRERYRRDGSLGFSVPGIVLPNMIRVETDDASSSDTVGTTPPRAVEPEPVEPEPVEPALGAAEPEPPPDATPPVGEPLYVVADAVDTIEVVEGLDADAAVLTTVQTSEALKVRLPPFEHDGATWAEVQAFAAPTGAVAVGYARIATTTKHLIQSLRF